jgi:hypothetical protein
VNHVQEAASGAEQMDRFQPHKAKVSNDTINELRFVDDIVLHVATETAMQCSHDKFSDDNNNLTISSKLIFCSFVKYPSISIDTR